MKYKIYKRISSGWKYVGVGFSAKDRDLKLLRLRLDGFKAKYEPYN